MGDVSLNCKLSLSKKLRAILKDSKGNPCSIVLTAPVVIDGKGVCKLSISSEYELDTPGKITDLGETSLQIEPIEKIDETPNNGTVAQGSIFSSIPEEGVSEAVVDKMAAVHPPEKKDISHAVVKDIKTPEAFKEVNDPKCKAWISNMEEFIEAINISKKKKSDIDPSVAENDRERAVLEEQKEMDEGLDVPAWVVNTKYATMSINDLNISLNLNCPFDLSKISARKIAYSNDLKSLLKSGNIDFLSPSEKDGYILGTSKAEKATGLDVYSSFEEAEASITNGSVGNPIINDESAMEITEGDMGHTDEESMILNLTQAMPQTKSSPVVSDPISGTRRTTHSRSNGTPQAPNTPTIKPVSKL